MRTSRTRATSVFGVGEEGRGKTRIQRGYPLRFVHPLAADGLEGEVPDRLGEIGIRHPLEDRGCEFPVDPAVPVFVGAFAEVPFEQVVDVFLVGHGVHGIPTT